MGTADDLTRDEKKQRLRISAEKIYDDYVKDAELTIFTTSLASEPFIETVESI